MAAAAVACSGCQTRDRRVAELQDEVKRLRQLLDESQRAGKRQTHPFRREQATEQPKKSGRRKGHKADLRPVPTPDQIDRVIDVPLDECPMCQAPLYDQGQVVQYQTDLPPIAPIVTQFNIETGYCSCCRQYWQGRHPDQTSDAIGATGNTLAHQDAAKVRLAHELMQEYPPDPQTPSGSLAVFRTGKPEIVGEITDEMLVQAAKDERHLSLIRMLGLKSYICVPLVVSGNPLGVLTFATAESGRRYTDADLALAMDLAHRAAVAIENTQLYQALREADRRKDEFLATLAHELRNPLAPIRNSLQILKMPRVDAETVERSRDMMERQVHHLVRLVDDLLDVSRVMRGKIELRKERVELATVVARAVETVQPTIEAQGHELTVT